MTWNEPDQLAGQANKTDDGKQILRNELLSYNHAFTISKLTFLSVLDAC